MLPPEWICQPEWIKIAKINFLNSCKKNNVPICNRDIFALHILGVKCCFHPRNVQNKGLTWCSRVYTVGCWYCLELVRLWAQNPQTRDC